MNIGCLACLMLAVCDTTHKGVELGTAEAGTNEDWDVEVLAERFKDVLA